MSRQDAWSPVESPRRPVPQGLEKTKHTSREIALQVAEAEKTEASGKKRVSNYATGPSFAHDGFFGGCFKIR